MDCSHSVSTEKKIAVSDTFLPSKELLLEVWPSLWVSCLCYEEFLGRQGGWNKISNL